MRIVTVVVAGVVLTVGGLVACGGSSDESSSGQTPAPKSTVKGDAKAAQQDVKLKSCVKDDLGQMVAKVTIKNSTDGPKNYFVTIAFEATKGNEQLATGDAAVENLDPGQSRSVDAESLTEGPKVTKGFTCRVVEVTRSSF